MTETQWAAVDALAASGLPGFGSLAKVGGRAQRLAGPGLLRPARQRLS
jgi:hypothetical protein